MSRTIGQVYARSDPPTLGPNLLVQSRSSRDFAIQDDPQKHRQDLSQINYERNFWNILGQTHRPIDQICSFRVDPAEILQFKNSPKTSTGALTYQLRTWYFIIITGHLMVSDQTGHILVSDQTGHRLVSDQTGHKLVSDQIGHRLVSDQIGHRLVSDQFEIPVSRTRYPRYRYLVLYFFVFCFLSRFQLKTLI